MTGDSETRSSDEQLDKLLGNAYESALGLGWNLGVDDVLGRVWPAAGKSGPQPLWSRARRGSDSRRLFRPAPAPQRVRPP